MLNVRSLFLVAPTPQTREQPCEENGNEAKDGSSEIGSGIYDAGSPEHSR